MTITRESLRTAVVLAKFFLLMVVISVVIRIGLSLGLPPHWAAVGQLMGTLAFGLCILLSPLRPRYFQYPSVRDQEKVPQDNEQPHGGLYFVTATAYSNLGKGISACVCPGLRACICCKVSRIGPDIFPLVARFT